MAADTAFGNIGFGRAKLLPIQEGQALEVGQLVAVVPNTPDVLSVEANTFVSRSDIRVLAYTLRMMQRTGCVYGCLRLCNGEKTDGNGIEAWKSLHNTLIDGP